jgi:hypothetical protein
MDDETTERDVTEPTVLAFENAPTERLLATPWQGLDYRVSILEAARAQEHQQPRGQNWQPYALGAGGLVLLGLAALAAKEQVSKGLLIGGLVVIGLFCLMLAYASLPAPASAQASA